MQWSIRSGNSNIQMCFLVAVFLFFFVCASLLLNSAFGSVRCGLYGKYMKCTTVPIKLPSIRSSISKVCAYQFGYLLLFYYLSLTLAVSAACPFVQFHMHRVRSVWLRAQFSIFVIKMLSAREINARRRRNVDYSRLAPIN